MALADFFLDLFIKSNGELFLRILISTILGLIIGWDRTTHNKPAGIKTYTYVTVSCTLITIISIESAALLSIEGNGTMMDPMRIAAQIVSGLGFLGAGLIMKNGFKVKGLTSAAMIFFAGGVGIGIGVGLYDIVIFSIIITLLIIRLGNYLENKTGKSS